MGRFLGEWFLLERNFSEAGKKPLLCKISVDIKKGRQMLSMGKSEVEEGDTHDYFDCGDEYEYARGKTTAECGNCYAQGYYGAAGGRDESAYADGFQCDAWRQY